MNRVPHRTLPHLVVILLLAGCSRSVAGIRVSHAWVRPADVGENSAVYFQIENRGPDDRLVGVHTDASRQASIHQTAIGEDGVAQMRPQTQIEVPAGGRLVFRPGGYHVMLMELTQTLGPGGSISVTLVFEDAGQIGIEVPIQHP
jgi:hypothetical protein